MENQAPESQVQQYFKDKTIFLTGGTGFLGKLLVEKLLRSCSQVRKIYLLIRTKGNKSAQMRLMDLYNDDLFDLCRSQVQMFKDLFLLKIEAVEGDSSFKDLIFDPIKRQQVIDETQICISFAASISFHSPLIIALRDNYFSALYSLEFAQQCKNIECLTWCSTLSLKAIKFEVCLEEINIPERDPEEIVQELLLLPKEELIKKQKQIINPQINTYAYTKNLVEQTLFKKRGSLRILISRPILISGPVKEPIPGWTQEGQGASKLQYLIAKGILKDIAANENSIVYIIPGDIAINATLAMIALRSNDNSFQIMNLCTSSINPLLWEQFARDSVVTLKNLNLCHDSNYYGPNFLSKGQFLQVYKEMERKVENASKEKQYFLKKQLKIYLSYFRDYKEFSQSGYLSDSSNHDQLVESLNETDKKIFYCDARQINWKIYLQNSMKGAVKEYEGKRVFLQKL